MKWHKNEINHVYWLICSLSIDDNLNCTVDTSEYDKFKLSLDENIKNYKIIKSVDRSKTIIVEVTILEEDVTQAFEYDMLTLMMQKH